MSVQTYLGYLAEISAALGGLLLLFYGGDLLASSRQGSVVLLKRLTQFLGHLGLCVLPFAVAGLFFIWPLLLLPTVLLVLGIGGLSIWDRQSPLAPPFRLHLHTLEEIRQSEQLFHDIQENLTASFQREVDEILHRRSKP